jgi:acyl carrier protein
MNRDEIRRELGGIVQRAVARKIDIGVVPDDARLRDDLGVGSLDVMEIIYSIEDAFGIELEDREVLSLVKVGDVIDLVQKKVAAKSPRQA